MSADVIQLPARPRSTTRIRREPIARGGLTNRCEVAFLSETIAILEILVREEDEADLLNALRPLWASAEWLAVDTRWRPRLDVVHDRGRSGFRLVEIMAMPGLVCALAQQAEEWFVTASERAA